MKDTAVKLFKPLSLKTGINMNFLKELWKKIPTKTKVYAAIIIASIFTIIYYNLKISSLESMLKVSQNNVSALKDTVRMEKTKNGELEFVRLALLADKKSLKDINDSLDREVKKEKGKVKVLIQAPMHIIGTKPIIVESNVKDSSIYWNYDKEDSSGSRHLSGISDKKITKIIRDEISLNLITGIKERDDKKMEIFIRTKYPGVIFGNIQGAIIDPTKPMVKPSNKYFSIGPCVGIMINPTGKFSYGAGVSVQWSIFKF